MRLQIEIQEVSDSGDVVNDDVFASLESDMLPPVGATIHLNGYGIVKVVEHMWSVDAGFGGSDVASMHVHVITRKDGPIE